MNDGEGVLGRCLVVLSAIVVICLIALVATGTAVIVHRILEAW